MPIRAVIGDASFTREQVLALNEAFGAALVELKLMDRQDPAQRSSPRRSSRLFG
jgi:hypothetical protein